MYKRAAGSVCWMHIDGSVCWADCFMTSERGFTRECGYASGEDGDDAQSMSTIGNPRWRNLCASLGTVMMTFAWE